MTVQKLIEELQKVKNKELEVNMIDMWDIHSVVEFEDYVSLEESE